MVRGLDPECERETTWLFVATHCRVVVPRCRSLACRAAGFRFDGASDGLGLAEVGSWLVATMASAVSHLVAHGESAVQGGAGHHKAEARRLLAKLLACTHSACVAGARRRAGL